jgi:glutamate dehydrogenase/leucine dehydrogenase
VKQSTQHPFLASAQRRINSVAKQLNLSDIQTKYLLKADAKHTFDIEVKTDNGIVKLPAYRVQHNNVRGPYKGGIRFHPEVELEEVEALALLMAIKTAAVGLPLGGGKGGVAFEPRDFNDNQLEQISRSYVQNLYKYIGPHKDVPAPDVNTNAQIIDWMVDEYSLLTGDKTRASFTGKSLKNGGSEGREAATGRGGLFALEETLKSHHEARELTVAVQGIGNVGYWFAKLASNTTNLKVIAISDSKNTITSVNGLDIDSVLRAKSSGKSVADYIDRPVSVGDSEDILKSDVDILVLAALDDAVRADNFEIVKARYLLELANGPVSDEAHEELHKLGKIIIPDVVANAGGVIVSYYEWLQNLADEKWTEQEVNQRLEVTMRQAVDEMVSKALQEGISYKEAAFRIAVLRLININHEGEI